MMTSCGKCETCENAKMITCSDCNGYGYYPIVCTDCTGLGYVKVKYAFEHEWRTVDCNNCNGEGCITRNFDPEWECTTCNGNGHVTCPDCNE